MIKPAVLTKQEKKDLDEINKANLHIALQERSGALERGILLSEITGRPGYKVELHHILGRGIPDGFEKAPDIIKEFWPHIPPGCVFLTTAEHQHAAGNSKMMRRLLLRWVLIEYMEEVWQGRPYWEWLNEPPFREWL